MSEVRIWIPSVVGLLDVLLSKRSCLSLKQCTAPNLGRLNFFAVSYVFINER